MNTASTKTLSKRAKEIQATEAELQKQINECRTKLEKINSAKRRKANQPYVGRCFKYLNSYSGDEKWWLYLRVTKGGENLKGHKFQKCAHGRLETHYDEYCGAFPAGWVEITHKEFRKAWGEFLAEVVNLNCL